MTHPQILRNIFLEFGVTKSLITRQLLSSSTSKFALQCKIECPMRWGYFQDPAVLAFQENKQEPRRFSLQNIQNSSAYFYQHNYNSALQSGSRGSYATGVPYWV